MYLQYVFNKFWLFTYTNIRLGRLSHSHLSGILGILSSMFEDPRESRLSKKDTKFRGVAEGIYQKLP